VNGTVVARRTRTTFVEPGSLGTSSTEGPSPARGSRQVGFEAASTLAGRPRSGAGRCWDLRHGRLVRVARRAYGLHVRAHAHRAGDAGRPRAISWPWASTATSPSQWTSSSSSTRCGNSARTWVGKARCLLDCSGTGAPWSSRGPSLLRRRPAVTVSLCLPAGSSSRPCSWRRCGRAALPARPRCGSGDPPRCAPR
jgi:hypothetical protein